MTAILYSEEFNCKIIEVPPKCRLIPIVRTDEELFSTTVERAYKKAAMHVCINSCWYGLTNQGLIDVLAGDDPVLSSETLNEGFALQGNGVLSGHSSPSMYFIAQKIDYSWFVGKGDLTKSDYYTGVGGLCPLIVNGLNYGDGNKYSKLIPDSTLVGPPKSEHIPFLIQRNNNKYAALSKLTNDKGRAGFGITSKGGCVVIVKADGVPTELEFDGFRDIFRRKGCVTALAVDGSDSVFLYHNGQFIIKAGHNKDESQTFGIGFRSEG